MGNEEGNHPPERPPSRVWVPIVAAIIGAAGVIGAAYMGIIFEEPKTSTIQGVVTDTEGMPVVGAVIEIDGLSATTDASGVYVIHNVPTGTKTIVVHAPGAEVIKRALRVPKGGEIAVCDVVIPPVSPSPTVSCVKPQMMAYSPDGKMYACEISPENFGHIGIFEVSTDGLIRKIKVTQHPDGEFGNYLKKLVWSPDNKYLAVMYHHGEGGHISIVNVDTGMEIKLIPIDKWYHYIEFSSDGTKIIADGDILTPTMVKITYPPNGSEVEREVTVRGTSQNIPEGQIIWIVIYVHEVCRYFPQDLPADVRANGDWESSVIIGVEDDVDKRFDIIVVLVDQKAQDAFNDYLDDWKGEDSSPGLERLPEGAVIYERTTVTRI